jgi:hypothetical protein
VLKDAAIPPANPLSFQNSWQDQTQFANFQLNASNAPSSINGCLGDAGPSPSNCAQLRVTPAVGDITFDSSPTRQETNFNISAGGSASVTMQVAKNAFDSLQYEVDIFNGPGNQAFVKNLVPVTASDSVDLTNVLLPAITASSLDASDPLHPRVSWTVAPNDAYFMEIGVSWYHDSDAGSSGQTMNWGVLAPATTPSPYTYPDLPATLAAWMPTSISAFNQPFLFIGKISLYHGYTDLLFNGYGFLFGDGHPPTAQPFTAAITSLSNGK